MSSPDLPAKVQTLPRWLWLWFPPLLILIIMPVRIIDPEAYKIWIDGELGLIELLTPLISIIGAVIGIAAFRLRARLPDRRMRVWILMVTLGCIYFAGEELSWGQHLFGWGTPQYLEAINDQEETNLHNVSSWFDQKPRLLLEIWVLVGGIIVPLRVLFRPQSPRAVDWFWPKWVCLPTASLAILVRLPERIKSLFQIESLPLEIRFSEPQEYYFALFLMLYLAHIYQRLRTT